MPPQDSGTTLLRALARLFVYHRVQRSLNLAETDATGRLLSSATPPFPVFRCRCDCDEQRPRYMILP